MSKAKRPTVAQQLELLGIADWTPRRVERAFNVSVGAARLAGGLSREDDAAVTLGRALARAVDMAETTRDPWALAAVTREFRALLERLRLDPVARGASPADELAELLAAMARPDTD